jgi:adenylate cyclase
VAGRFVGPATVTMATIALVLLLFAFGGPLLHPIELRTYDFRVRIRGASEPLREVVVAAIDEKSLDAEGRWPWPRSKIAALVDALSEGGARVIAFDVAFAESDPSTDVAVVREVERKVQALGIQDERLTEFIEDRRQRADNDARLARAIERSSAAIVLGYFFHLRQADLGYPLDPEEIEERVRRIGPSRFPVIASRAASLDAVPFVRAYAPQPNLEALSEVASSSGYFSVMSDPDGVLRWFPVAIQAGEDVFPSLALLSAWEYLGRPALVLRVGDYGVEGVTLGGRWIPTHESGQLLVNYMGPPHTFRHVSVTDILREKVEPGAFAGKIVLVGATAVGTHDLRATPFSPVHPGTEIHANVIDNILSGRLLERPQWWKILDLLAVVLLTVFVGVVIPRMGALRGLVVQSTLFGGYALFAVWLFAAFGVWISMVHPLLAISVNYTGLTTYRYLTEERERRKIKSTFSQYVAPVVVEEMLKNPQALRLGGEEKDLTVLFSDLEGFTTYTERHTPREMIEILSEYYGRVTEQVFAHEGTLKEYVGDELMAFFGAPFDQPDHAERACRAALGMRDTRLALNAEWAHLGRPQLRARTGVNSGPMLVGNLGSKYRFAYGVLGDQVNLGSRLEGLNRVYGTEILIGENTAALVADKFVLRELDAVRAKGKTQAIRVHELVAVTRTSLPRGQETALALYATGLDAYRAQRWHDALALFEEALSAWPEDGPSRAMAERCRAYGNAPPLEHWDGVYEQTLKTLKEVG